MRRRSPASPNAIEKKFLSVDFIRGDFRRWRSVALRHRRWFG